MYFHPGVSRQLQFVGLTPLTHVPASDGLLHTVAEVGITRRNPVPAENDQGRHRPADIGIEQAGPEATSYTAPDDVV